MITLFPERIRTGKSVFLGEDHEEYQVVSVRWKNALMVLRFAGFNNPEEAARLTNLEVFTRTLGLPKLPEGQYYHHQLIGLKVWQADEYLGELVDIMETGANDVYIIASVGSQELLIPAIPDVIIKIDLEAGTIQVELLEGLRD